jgi:tRNA pseudouridine55 synthase
VIEELLGLVVVDKPKGLTSHDVVAVIRRALGVRRVGHAGTLDPPATGVLLVGVGRATRLLRFLEATSKRYDGTLSLGATTNTLDATGTVTATFDMTSVTEAQVRAAARSLTGDLEQVPPMVSAIHHEGRRLHELAREGIEVPRKPRRVHVERFDVAPLGDGSWSFGVECSPGTYVRSLVDDLGGALGGGAHLTSLRRTGVGRFSLDDAHDLEAIRDGSLSPLEMLLSPRSMVEHLGVVTVDRAAAGALARGGTVHVDAGVQHPGDVAVCNEAGALVAVAVLDAQGAVRPEVVVASGAPRDED